MLGQCAALYRELIKVGIHPGQADELEIWQIAALMTSASGMETPDDASDRFLRERVQAAREGRKIDAEEMVSAVNDVEAKQLLGQEGVSAP